MIADDLFGAHPWCLRENRLDLEALPVSETLFALANGHIGWRANLDEGEPHGLPGSYLNGVYEVLPLPYAEAGYGYPESGETVVNVTNGKLIRLLVDDEPLDVRYGRLVTHERELDFRDGVLRRRLHWVSPAGQAIKVSATRIVSFTQRAIAAICYEVEAVDQPARVVLQSELVANEQLPERSGDPRAAAVVDRPLRSEGHAVNGGKVGLVHRVARSGLLVATAMDHIVEPPDDLEIESSPDLGRVAMSSVLQPGERLRLVKFVAYGWSGRRSVPAVRDQVDAALTAARETTWDGLLDEQREYLDRFWTCADVEIDGDADVQQAVRFGLFHVLQAGARAEGRAIPAKGLTGPGYDGHAFWDTEMFALPTLTYTNPDAVAHALRWRHSTIPLALQRAADLKLRGTAFPWRTITGAECSGYWPAGTAAFHVNAGIANAVVQYVEATGDTDFAGTVGVDLLVHTARLWRSFGHYDDDGQFRIDGVTGPDEYTAIVDNNVYTNLMAKRNLQAASQAAHDFPQRAHQLAVDADEAASWRHAADAMTVPYDEKRGLHPQSDGFLQHERWDFAGTPADAYPLLLHYPYFQLYRKQVVKQADLVLAMYLFPDEFTADQKARNFAYYEQLTVRDSSLSASSQAIMAAEVGALDLAHDYLAETALTDLDDLHRNTVNGLHIASLASTWLTIVAGFGGMRHRDGALGFAPRLPPRIGRISFGVRIRSCTLRVDVGRTTARYTLAGAEPLTFTHYDDPVTLDPGVPLELPIRPARVLPPPSQPSGREPRHR